MKNKYLLTSKEKVYTELELLKILSEVTVQNYLEISKEDLKLLLEIDYVSIKDGLYMTAFYLEDGEELLSEKVVDAFEDSVNSINSVFSFIKFYDSNLKSKYLKIYSKIYDLENRLREALMIILSDTYKGDIKLFLEDYNFKTQNSFNCNKSVKLLENELFHLLFTDYVKFENRKSIKKIKIEELLTRIESFSSYEELKDSIQNTGIVKQKYMIFLSEIKENLDSIERARNCIAHNRAMSEEEKLNFEMSYPEIVTALDNFFSLFR